MKSYLLVPRVGGNTFEPPLQKQRGILLFLTRSFLITKPLNISSKNRLYSTVDLFSVDRVIWFNIYEINKRFFIFQGKKEEFQVLK